MKTFLVSALLCCLTPAVAAGQILAGSQEDKMFQLVSSEKDAEVRLQRLTEYEKQFPQSKALSHVYLMAIDIYREKADRAKLIEYGEKVLKLDGQNVTAMMVLSRNYAIERKNLERAVELAQKAVDVIGTLKAGSPPTSQTQAQWQNYLETTEAAAQNILEYAKTIQSSLQVRPATKN
jgi:hypothetical protein